MEEGHALRLVGEETGRAHWRRRGEALELAWERRRTSLRHAIRWRTPLRHVERRRETLHLHRRREALSKWL